MSFIAYLGATLTQQGYTVQPRKVGEIQGWRVFTLGSFVADVWLEPNGRIQMSPSPGPEALFWWGYLRCLVKATVEKYKSENNHEPKKIERHQRSLRRANKGDDSTSQ